MQKRFAAKYAWSSQAHNNSNKNPTIPPEVKPLDLTKCQVFDYKTGNLDSRLSREIGTVSKQEISNLVLAPTIQNQHALLANPKIAESEVTVNVAALRVSTVTKSPVIVKEPSIDDEKLTQGLPNKTDRDLTAGKSKDTTVLRQWYIDAIVQKSVLHISHTEVLADETAGLHSMEPSQSSILSAISQKTRKITPLLPQSLVPITSSLRLQQLVTIVDVRRNRNFAFPAPLPLLLS